jgi:NTP pyrophosphatase (non-canonical NTP hydrolase)
MQNNTQNIHETTENATYSDFVRALCKPGNAVIEDLNTTSAHLLHMAVGVSGEAGELLDAIKRHALYKKDLDIKNTIEELGDLMFYMQGVMNTLGITWDQIADANRTKLSARYSKLAYSNQSAIERADKENLGEPT